MNLPSPADASVWLEGLLRHLPLAFAVFDRDFACIEASAAWRHALGLGDGDLHGAHALGRADALRDDWLALHRRCMQGDSGSCRASTVDFTFASVEAYPLRRDGEVCASLFLCTAGGLADGGTSWAGIFERLFDLAPVGFNLCSMDGLWLESNPAFLDIIGYTAEEADGKLTYWQLTPADYEEQEQAQLQRLRDTGRYGPYEKEFLHKDGHRVPVRLSGFITERAGEPLIWSVVEDMSAERDAQEQIYNLAFYDVLTGLPNRRLFMDRLGHAHVTSGRRHRWCAVMLVDLDNFKTLNDTLGHAMGDRLLIGAAQRLRDSVRQQDTVARLGADEFAVMLEDLDTAESTAAQQAERVADKVRTALSAPYQLSADMSEPYLTTPSVGITLFCGQDEAPEALLRQADLSLFQAKNAGRNTVRFFNPLMQAEIEHRASLEARLKRAIATDELQLHLQPQFDADNRLIGAEALLRWIPRDTGKPVSPMEFIPVAEDTGLILTIGRWVLEQACRMLSEWSDGASARLSLAVNVSARQFHQAGFAHEVARVLQDTGADPRRLELELTESVVLADVDNVVRNMSALRDLGVSFALDDFGTGYSSLSYLKRLPIRQVKIDRSFVKDVVEDISDATIVRAILAIAESLGISAIAEGVETAVQHRALMRLGCRGFQGYLLGRPMPLDEFQALVATAGDGA